MEVVELDGPHRLTAHGVVEAAIAAIGDHAFFEQVRCTPHSNPSREQHL